MVAKYKMSLILFSLLFPILGKGGEWHLLGLQNEGIHSVAVHPTNSSIIFAGGQYLYKSEDGGSTWTTVSGAPANFITFSPSNPDTMYYTFGEGSYSDGLYRSEDGGNTWDVLYYLMYADALTFSSFPPGGILIGSNGNGVYRSDDGGTTWYEMNDSLNDLNVYSLVSISPFDTADIFLAGTGTGIYYFTDHWRKANAPNTLCRKIREYNNISPILWAVFNGGDSSGLYISNDYGFDWSMAKNMSNITDVLINPLDSQIVYASDSGSGVIVSRDGGITWSFINENLGDSIVYCLAQSPLDTSHLYAGTQHGLYVYNFYAGIHENNKKTQKTALRISPVLTYGGAPVNISYFIPDELFDKMMDIKIYGIGGRVIKTLYKGRAKSGWNTLIWNTFHRCGIYFIYLEVGKSRLIKKVILL